jgi:large subunit ribosomal protein L29
MTMKAKELRERSVEDLRELEKSLAKDSFTNRFKNMTNRLDNTSAIGETRRDLARVKTILRQLEINAETKATAEAPAKPAAKPAPKKASRKRVQMKARPKTPKAAK